MGKCFKGAACPYSHEGGNTDDSGMFFGGGGTESTSGRGWGAGGGGETGDTVMGTFGGGEGGGDGGGDLGGGFGGDVFGGNEGGGNLSNFLSRSGKGGSSGAEKKAKPCRYWLEGSCRNGDNCRFAHPAGLQGSKAKGGRGGRETGKNFLARSSETSWMEDSGGSTGFEAGGGLTESEFEKGRGGGGGKGAICKFYLKGDCKFGDRCKNYHPEGLQGSRSGGG
eukprot:1040399-Amorphochlora_amoeboformis.AAC.1